LNKNDAMSRAVESGMTRGDGHYGDRNGRCASERIGLPKDERGDGGRKGCRVHGQAPSREAEKKELLDRLTKPSGVSDDERMRRAATIIKRAVSNGLTEVEVGRFSNKLCTDLGRAINQQEPGWEETLTGLPKEIYHFWKKHLEPRGYRVKYQIADWPNGMPGDISITLMWR
jgi:hypothetical protein